MSSKRDYQLGLIGWKLGHSLSPAMHNAALEALALTGDYRLYSIDPADSGSLVDLLDKVRRGEIDGLNVTIPHKQNVMPLLDALTPTAEQIGAVNTIIRDKDKLLGDNTDAAGFLYDLENFFAAENIELLTKEKEALILGAGGAARAVVYALAQAGWNVAIAARRVVQAAELVESLGIGNAHVIDLTEQEIAALSPHLIVNATPVGMFPQGDASPWPEGLVFPAGAAIYDLVYNPPITQLVAEAHAVNIPAITGLGMLVEQGAAAFQTWIGQESPRTVMRVACKTALAAQTYPKG
ncbi:MAG: shikimate dehydrogenase [Anaerolineales bacterium]|nr:shikimate dehydrogenase [Anaerolineales bacterium]